MSFITLSSPGFWIPDSSLSCFPLPTGSSLVTTSAALEELSIRSNMALAQKRVLNDITGGTEPTITPGGDFEQEYLRLSAQVVSYFVSTVLQCIALFRVSIPTVYPIVIFPLCIVRTRLHSNYLRQLWRQIRWNARWI